MIVKYLAEAASLLSSRRANEINNVGSPSSAVFAIAGACEPVESVYTKTGWDRIGPKQTPQDTLRPRRCFCAVMTMHRQRRMLRIHFQDGGSFC